MVVGREWCKLVYNYLLKMFIENNLGLPHTENQ